MKAAKLVALQNWMQTVIADEDGVQSGVESEAAQRALALEFDELEEVVLPSAGLTAAERIGIYSDAYRIRLIECLQEDYPALVYALGTERFSKLAHGYITAHPSTHFSLNQFGARLADWIASTNVKKREFYAELARLERGISEVFDGPAVEPLAAGELQKVAESDWPALRLVTSPGIRLFAFRFPVNRFYQAFREGAKPAIPRESASFCAAYRKDYRVWRANLSREQHVLLGELMKGRNLSQALETCSTTRGVDLEKLAASLGDWFREWNAEGLFVGLSISA